MKEKKRYNFNHEPFTIAVRVPEPSNKDCLELALKKFKKLVKDSGKMDELKERQSFEKKCVKRRKDVLSASYRQSIISAREKLERYK